jgi:mRNA guanylyltransferase
MASTSPLTSTEAPGIKIEGELLQRMRFEVASLLQRKNNLNFPGAQPVSFARRHLEDLLKTEYGVLCA